MNFKKENIGQEKNLEKQVERSARREAGKIPLKSKEQINLTFKDYIKV